MLISKSELTLASKCHFPYNSDIHSNQIYIKLPTVYIDTWVRLVKSGIMLRTEVYAQLIEQQDF